MEILKRQKIISIGVTIVLLIGLVVGVVLVQRQQTLKSRASLQAYNAFNVASAEAGKYVKCEGNVCETNTLNITISVRDLQALIIQEQQQAADEQPIVDDQSQNSALSSYFQSAAEVADQEDQEWARERGLPDAEAQSVSSTLISTLEKGLDVPDELWQDFGSTLGNLSQGAVDLVTSQVQQAQEQGEQKRSEEAVAEAERLVQQDEKEYLEGLEKWKNATPAEKAGQIRATLNIPSSIPDDQVLNYSFNQLNEVSPTSGLVFKPAGDSFNLELTSSQPASTTTIGIDQPVQEYVKYFESLSPDEQQRVLKNEFYPEDINKFYLNLATSGFSDLFEKSLKEANEEFQKLEDLRIKAGLEHRLTNEEIKRVLAIKEESLALPDEFKAKQEYARALIDQHKRIKNLTQEAQVWAAMNIVGGPVTEFGLNTAKTAIRPLTDFLGKKLSKPAGSLLDSTIGRLFDRNAVRREAAVLSEAEPVYVGLLQESQDAAQVVGIEVLPDYYFPLRELREYSIDTIERANQIRARFPTPPKTEAELISERGLLTAYKSNNERGFEISRDFHNRIYGKSAELKELEGQLLAQYADRQIPEDVILANFELADAYLRGSLKDLSAEQVQIVQNALAIGARLRSSMPENIPFQRLQVLDVLTNQQVDVRSLQPVIDAAKQNIQVLQDYVRAEGTFPVALYVRDDLFDLNRFHMVSPEVMKKMSIDPLHPAAGIYSPTRDAILIRSDYQNFNTVCTHECIHRATFYRDKQIQKSLYPDLGEENANKLLEGATEWVNQFAFKIRGLPSEYTSYRPQVDASEQIVEIMAKALSSRTPISRERANAVMINAVLAGDFDTLFLVAGDGSYSAGKYLVKEILDKAPEAYSNVVYNDIVAKRAENVVRGLAIGALAADLGILINPQDKPRQEEEVSPALIPLKLVGEVNAQTNDDDDEVKVINVNALELLAKNKLIKNQLEEIGSVNKEFILQTMGDDIFKADVIQTTNGYTFITDKSGMAERNIKQGNYIVNIKPLRDLDIKVPSMIVVKQGITTVPIAIRKGSGKVEKTSGLSGGVGAGETARVKVAAFYDENGNGNWDGREKALPWAGIQVTLSKVIQEKTIHLIEGWNLVILPALPVTPLTAKGLLVQIAKQGGSATAVSTLENGFWKSYVMRENQDYSIENFIIEPGKTYFVNALKASTFTFTGQEFISPVKLKP